MGSGARQEDELCSLVEYGLFILPVIYATNSSEKKIHNTQ